MNNNETKKVLLTFVGNRDPYPSKPAEKGKDNRGSILALCDEIKPDIVYLFPSSKKTAPDPKNQTEDNASEVVGVLKKQYPTIECVIMPLEVKDPTDFLALAKELDKKISKILEDRCEPVKYKFHMNCTSATQQMTAWSYIFCNSGRIPAITSWQSIDPRFVLPSGKRNRKISTSFVEENTCIKNILSGVKSFNFHSVKENCRKIADITTTSIPERRDVAKILVKLFEAYTSLDILGYWEAYKTIRKIPTVKLDCDSQAIICSQVEWLEELKNEKIEETPSNLTDLYFNMQRCFERGAYADVLARFWRIAEGSVNFRLQNQWGINPRDLNNSPNETNLKTLRDQLSLPQSNYDRELLLFQKGRKALEVFNDPYYSEIKEKYRKKPHDQKSYDDELKEMIDKRNNTIVAHGMRPVSEQDARKCLEIAKDFLQGLIPDCEKRMQEYPFTKERLQKLVSLLK